MVNDDCSSGDGDFEVAMVVLEFVSEVHVGGV